MQKLCDLHTHSVFSDGTCTPGEIIDTAVRIGLSAVALCDHNTVDGIPDFLSAAKGKDIRAIAGAEFSVAYEDTELHLLGLFIPEEAFAHVTTLMEDVNRRKEESNRALIASLNRAGYEIDFEAIRNMTPNGKFNRSHIAQAMTDKGYTESISQAMNTVLAPGAGHYIEPRRISVWEMIDFIKSVGAVPVLAHPFLNLSEAALAQFLPEAKKHGLVGMECAYSLYDKETTAKSLLLAEKNGLLPSGGSDFHGTKKADIRLGCGKGNLAIPYAWAERLENQPAE